MNRVTSRLSRQALRLLAPFLLAGAFAGAVFAADAPRRFDLPVDDAERALKRFSEQAGQQVLFPSDVVRGVRTNAVAGELDTAAALEQMLAGTGLEAVRDGRTGAFTVRRGLKPETNQKVQRTDDGAVRLQTLEVSASRIDGPVNQTIFSTTETGVYHYDVINRVEIERMGATNMEELLRFVPQTSDYGSTALQGAVANPQSPGGATYQNSEVKLRGFSSLQTSILINGRRLQRGNLSAGADLNRIPVAAIERIEILPSSASAIYGGGAIGGVINIILRKDYAGRDLTAYVGTSTDGGATEYRFTYFEGRSFNDQRTRLSYTLDYFHRDPLYLDDRNYLQRALDRYPPDSALLVSGRPIYEQYIIPAFASNPGTIIINSPSGSLGIPGATTARFAAIPQGLTAAQASALTPGNFTATANRANLGGRFGRSMLYRPEDRYSLNATLEHTFVPDKLELYSEFGLSYSRSAYSFPQITPTITLTATDPLNPFRTGVTPGFVGVPISIVLDPVDLPDPDLFQDRRGVRGVLGFKGKLGSNWDWSLDGTGEWGRSHSEGTNPTQNLVNFINSTSTIGATTSTNADSVRREFVV
ncbi:MAG TPA: TonB-dependent receptor plug domain-containing protein [Acidobacteriota bacterium]|nr:TonB-dependent receptor plug domain-containing protein [Acidobacteriota bacterium]